MLQQVLSNFGPIADALNKGQLNVDEKEVVRQYARNIIIRCGKDPHEKVPGERKIDELGVIIDNVDAEVRIGNETYSAPQKVIDFLCQVSGERDELRSHLGFEESEAILNPKKETAPLGDEAPDEVPTGGIIPDEAKESEVGE